MSRLLKYMSEDGEGVANVGATTTDDIAQYQRKIGEPVRRKPKKKKMKPIMRVFEEKE